MDSWHDYFIDVARLVSTKSKDRSTKVGAVLVNESNSILSTGFNGFPRDVNDDVEERHDRPAKYTYTEHAERNAIFNAARVGVSTEGSILYLNFAPPPCADCSRGVIQAGISKVIGPPELFSGVGKNSSGWSYELSAGSEMLNEAGVQCLVWENDKLIHLNDWSKSL